MLGRHAGCRVGDPRDHPTFAGGDAAVLTPAARMAGVERGLIRHGDDFGPLQEVRVRAGRGAEAREELTRVERLDSGPV